MQLYPQQSEALDAMKRFVESETSVFILKGYAGTGKTTIIRAFSEMLTLDLHPRITDKIEKINL